MFILIDAIHEINRFYYNILHQVKTSPHLFFFHIILPQGRKKWNNDSIVSSRNEILIPQFDRCVLSLRERNKDVTGGKCESGRVKRERAKIYRKLICYEAWGEKYLRIVYGMRGTRIGREFKIDLLERKNTRRHRLFSCAGLITAKITTSLWKWAVQKRLRHIDDRR